MYKPPFNITANILNSVADISEKAGWLEQSGLLNSPSLRKKNRIKTIAGTLAIEGNTLSEEQITAIVDGKHIIGNIREIAEVKGAIKAYEQLETLDPFQENHLLATHSLMMGEVLENSGKYRNTGVGIHDQQKIVHMAPPHKMVPKLMGDLFSWLNKKEVHPLVLEAIFHYELEFIHPFIDGNGRMGRVWNTLILSKWKKVFLNLPMENIIKEHQKKYYQALRKSDIAGDCTEFVEFILEAMQIELFHPEEKNVPTNVSTNAPTNVPINILNLIKSDKYITGKEMSKILQKDRRTITRALAKLSEEKKIKRIGANKGGHWEIL